MIHEKPLSFYELSLRQQRELLLNVKSVKDLQQVAQIPSNDINKIEAWVVHWFKETTVKSNEVCIRKLKAALQIQQKFKHLFNEAFSQQILECFIKLNITPHNDLLVQKDAFSLEELKYFYQLVDDYSLKLAHTQSINKVITSFLPKDVNFDLIEAIIKILGCIKNPEDPWINGLLAQPPDIRKQLLMNLHGIFASSNDYQKNKKLLKQFFKFSPIQKADIFTRLLSMKNDKYVMRLNILKGMNLLPHTLPSEAYLNLKKFFEFAPCLQDIRIKFLKTIPVEKRPIILFSIAPHLKDELKFKNLQSLLGILSRGDPDKISELAPKAVQFFGWLDERLCGIITRKMEKFEKNWESTLGEIFDLLNLHCSWFEYHKNSETTFDLFKHLADVLFELNSNQVRELRLLLEVHYPKITSREHWIGLVISLVLFSVQEQNELVDLLIPLQLERSIHCFSIPLNAFPQTQRKDILLKSIPYITPLSTHQEIEEFMISIGLSIPRDLSNPSSKIILKEFSKKIREQGFEQITKDSLRKGSYNCSLAHFITGYLGRQNYPAAITAANQWIQRHALQIFHDPSIFFRELASNAFDAQLPLELQIGNFGCGFFSIFSLFFQYQEPIDRIEIDTCYKDEEELFAYRMIFTKDPQEVIQVKWLIIPPTQSGMTISIYPIGFQIFSFGFLQRLNNSLNDFRFFEHGYVNVNDKIILGNDTSKVSIYITLIPEEIKVRDPGCGISLSKLPFLLIPCLSYKRKKVENIRTVSELPSLKISSTSHSTSSIIFTVNTVVNSTYSLDQKYCAPQGIPCDLLIEFPKTFQSKLSRDGIVISGSKSPQAKAICRMIKLEIKKSFQDVRKQSSKLLMLYFGLIQWENKGLSNDLKGFFSGVFYRCFRKELAKYPDIIPCYSHPWLSRFNSWLFGDEECKYVPFPKELIPEGYLRYENAIINKYKQKILPNLPFNKELLEAALQRRMIEGMSVCFLDETWLKDKNDNIQVSSGPFMSVIFAPITLLQVNASFEDVQRKICQRFTDDGKRIQPFNNAKPSPLFSASIHIPTHTYKTLGCCFNSASEPLIDSFKGCLEYYLKSPLIMSLDKQACTEKFWKYYSVLAKNLTTTAHQYPYRVLFENVAKADLFKRGIVLQIDWKKWLQEAVIVDASRHRAFKANPKANLDALCCDISFQHRTQDKHGPVLLQVLLEKFEDHFEELPEDELFKRLCVLLLVQWGINPYDESSLYCYVRGEKHNIDLIIFEEGVKSFLTQPEYQNVHSRSIFYPGLNLSPGGMDFENQMAPFALLFSNLSVFLKPAQTIALVHNFHDMHLMRTEAPAYCAPYIEQLFEQYYHFLMIPSNEFAYRYGSNNKLAVNIEHEFTPISTSIHLLKKIPRQLAEKFLRGMLARFSRDLNLQSRFHYLQSDIINIRRLAGFNSLCLLTLYYDNRDENIALINLLLRITDLDEETFSLAAIIYFAGKVHPSFFQAPIEFQEDSLKIILKSIVRTQNNTEIEKFLKMNNFIQADLDQFPYQEMPSAIKSGIDCIEFFASKYASISNVDHKLFCDPAALFQDQNLPLFNFSDLMETFFNDPSTSDMFTKNDVEGWIRIIMQNTMTSHYKDFGMLTHVSSQEGGFSGWEIPWIELLKNSLQASMELSKRNGKEAKLEIKYALVPKDEENSQMVYEISDSAGFENLESLASMLIPGYHPKSSKHLGLGFFRMLPEVSAVIYCTRLQANRSKVVSLRIQPQRNPRNEITDLKIGIQQLDANEEIQGTTCRVFLRPQGNIEACMRLKQVHHFIEDTLKKCYYAEPFPISLKINGKHSHLMDMHRECIENQDTSGFHIYGCAGCFSAIKASVLLVDGFPHSLSLDQFLSDAGMLHYFYADIFNGGFISFPKECFVSLQDPTKLVIRPEALPFIQKYILDWLYFYLFDGKTYFLEHFDSSDGNYEQLIPKPAKLIDSPGEILKSLMETHDYFEFFNHYSYSGETQLNGHPIKIRVPSFSEYLLEAFKDVYSIWSKDKSQGKTPSFKALDEWINKKKLFFNPKGNHTLNVCNKHLLNLVNNWYACKFESFKHRQITKPLTTLATSSDGNAIRSSQKHPILSHTHPKWAQTISLIECILTYYVRLVLPKSLNSFSFKVCLCAAKNFSGQQRQNKIFINVFSHPVSKMLLLLEGMQRKKYDAHYIGDLIHSEHPSDAGTLNHEIYHAMLYAKGHQDEGHEHEHGINFEVRARMLADEARSRGVLTQLEIYIHEQLLQLAWSADTLKELAQEAEKIEAIELL